MARFNTLVSARLRHFWIQALLSLLTLGWGASATALTEFSADIRYLNDAVPTVEGRLYVTDHAIREERKSEKGREIRITDLYRGVMYVLDPQQSEYHQQQAYPIPRNPQAFCAEMLLAECGFRATEGQMGRKTERWAAELGFGALNFGVVAWYDPEIQYPVRIELDSGIVQELGNIERDRLSSALFSIPFHYRQIEASSADPNGNFPHWP